MHEVPERWTKASVYPDMWADPGEDPRNSEGVTTSGYGHQTFEVRLSPFLVAVAGHHAGIQPDAGHARQCLSATPMPGRAP
jgi:hypothetical protein